MDTLKAGFDTKLIHAGQMKDEFGSAVTPIYQTSTFAFRDAQHGADLFGGKEKGYIYTRIGNPTINSFENALAAVENGFGGIATSSGMSAVNTVYMSTLGAGKHMIGTSAIYGPSRVVIEKYFADFGVESTFLDTADAEAVEAAIQENTSLIYIETPANPTIRLTDIKKIAAIAHKHGIVLAVDNTFSSPYLQKPLDLGADISLHSLTKFINGHADLVGGAIVVKDEELYKKVRTTMVMMGGNIDPHQAFLAHRGLKTLSIRMDRAQENAMKVAEYLENHPKIAWVKYPGLKSFDQYDLAQEQMSGSGAMISFELKGGLAAGKTVMDEVKLALLAVSLGGVESLIQHPASMTHAGMTPEARKEAFISDGLVRFSVGIEDVSDIIGDLDQALAKA